MNQIPEEFSWYQEMHPQRRRTVSKALHVMETTYGQGDKKIIDPYYYHNASHTLMACEDIAVLKDALGLTPDEFAIAESAMAAHDIVKTFGRAAGTDEMESAEWLEQELARSGASRVACESGRLAVLGTTPRFDNGTIIQRATEQDYPNKRAELITHAVAGADVGRLYAPIGPLVSHRLFEETQSAANMYPHSLDALLLFQDSQIEFLTNYQYPSRDIERALATHKAAVIRYLGRLSRMLEEGMIESWGHLQQLDDDFIKENA